MIICKQYDNKKEKLLKLLNETAEKAEKAKVPAILYTLGGKYDGNVLGFGIKGKYGEKHIIGTCAKDHCIYFIVKAPLDCQIIIKSQLNKKEWKEVAQRIIFEATINDRLNDAFEGKPTADF